MPNAARATAMQAVLLASGALVPLRMWEAGHAHVDSPPVAMRACVHSGMRTASCLVCGGPIGSHPFTIHTVIIDGPCATGSAHLPSVTSPIHIDCPIPGDAEMCDRLIAVVQDCSD